MTFQKLFQQFNTFHPLTTPAWDELSSLFFEKNFKKNDFLTREGDHPKLCYFLTEGIVRVYYNKEGNEYNKTFFTPGTFPTALTALLTNTPCEINFQALTDSKTIAFSYSKFRKLFAKHRCLETLFLKIMEQIWVKKEKHDIRMVTNDATTNYLIFREEYPGLEYQIPQYHIASHLGITPIQLSRIRAQLAKKTS